jgi:hypothetical protein
MYCRKREWEGELESIFAIEFLKIFGVFYIDLLIEGEEIDYINHFDDLLALDNSSVSHPRVYLLKFLYHHEKDFKLINQKYLKV